MSEKEEPIEQPTPREIVKGLRRKRKLKIAAVVAVLLALSVGVAVALILSQSQPVALTETQYLSRMSGILGDYSRSVLRFTDTFEAYTNGVLAQTAARNALGDEFLVLGRVQDRFLATSVPCIAYQSMHDDVAKVFTATLNAEARILDFVDGDPSGLADASVGFNLAVGFLATGNAKLDTLETTLPNCEVA